MCVCVCLSMSMGVCASACMYIHNRRAGASQPSCPTGTIFLYICLYVFPHFTMLRRHAVTVYRSNCISLLLNSSIIFCRTLVGSLPLANNVQHSASYLCSVCCTVCVFVVEGNVCVCVWDSVYSIVCMRYVCMRVQQSDADECASASQSVYVLYIHIRCE